MPVGVGEGIHARLGVGRAGGSSVKPGLLKPGSVLAWLGLGLGLGLGQHVTPTLGAL